MIEEVLDSMNIERELDNIRNGSVSKQQMEILDRDITYALNKVRKRIKGVKQSIPYLKEKVRRNTVVQFWKMKLK